MSFLADLKDKTMETMHKTPQIRTATQVTKSGDGPQTANEAIKITVRGLSYYYGKLRALEDITMDIKAKRVTALIGPSGCGKSTYIKTFNRMSDLVPGGRLEGEIRIDGRNINGRETDVVELRRKVGMVFQKSTPFPKSIFDNVAYGLRILGTRDKETVSQVVEKSLKRAALWDEVKDNLNKSALQLSGGQQQRLCIARAIAVGPEVILMDEPCSALDPTATARIEELILELKDDYTIIIVTHNMQQAARVSDETGFLFMGKLIEFGPTEKIFTKPDNPMTESYITGRFG